MRHLLSALLMFLLSAFALAQAPREAQASGATPQTVAARTAQLEKRDGFLPFYWDARRGEVLFELAPAALQREFLYYTALGSGVGSIELFADRSSFGASGLFRFLRVGPRVLVVKENEQFRATSGSPDLRRSIELSFPTSVIAALPIEAESDGTLIVNANPLVVRDDFALLDQLRRPTRAVLGQTLRAAAPTASPWRMDSERSVVDMEHTRAFPLNTEVEALITFASDSAEGNLNQPDGRAVTVHQHHSFAALPEPGYEIRERDPRVGFFGITFQDFSRPYNEQLTRTLVERWRLQKKD